MEIVIGLLEKDETELRRKIDLVGGKANKLHVDIVDQDFAQNLTVGIDAIRNLGAIPSLAVHLMVANVDSYLASWCQTPVSSIIFYPKESSDTQGSIVRVQSAGKRVGLALDVNDGVDLVRPFINDIDFVLILTVPSGFAGARFNERPLSKIGALKSIKPDLVVGVDGGINRQTIKIAKEAGANFAVVNSAIFTSANPLAALEELTQDVS